MKSVKTDYIWRKKIDLAQFLYLFFYLHTCIICYPLNGGEDFSWRLAEAYGFATRICKKLIKFYCCFIIRTGPVICNS